MSKKEVNTGAFCVKEDEKGNIFVSTVSGFSMTYPSNSHVAFHISTFIEEEDVDSIHALLSLYYSITNIVLDNELYIDIIKSIQKYVDRNKKEQLEDDKDNDIIDSVKKELNDFERMIEK